MALKAEDIKRLARTPEGLWREHVAITKSDVTTYDPPLRGLLVMGAGDVICEDMEGTEVTYPSCPAGFFIHTLITKVKAATTASDLISGY